MTPDAVAHVINQAFWAAFWLCAPILIIAFITGILINLVQVATSLQDSTFSTIPRLAVFVFSVMLLMPYMLKRLMSYAVSILGDLSRYAH
jgi:flagellar biosynthetic protein FliQ